MLEKNYKSEPEYMNIYIHTHIAHIHHYWLIIKDTTEKQPNERDA